jgi:hypothetical protein
LIERSSGENLQWVDVAVRDFLLQGGVDVGEGTDRDADERALAQSAERVGVNRIQELAASSARRTGALHFLTKYFGARIALSGVSR